MYGRLIPESDLNHCRDPNLTACGRRWSVANKEWVRVPPLNQLQIIPCVFYFLLDCITQNSFGVHYSFDLWTYKRPLPLPPHILTWVCGGGGGTGSDVIIRTAALLSVEYHHSISLRTNTPSGRTLFTILLRTPSADSEERRGWNDANCRSENCSLHPRLSPNIQFLSVCKNGGGRPGRFCGQCLPT